MAAVDVNKQVVEAENLIKYCVQKICGNEKQGLSVLKEEFLQYSQTNLKTGKQEMSMY